MQQAHLHIVRISLLATLAAALGVLLLGLDQQRRAEAAQAPPPAVASAQHASARARAAAAAGSLVANAAPPAAAAQPATPPAPDPIAPVVVQKRGGVPCAQPHHVVEVPRNVVTRAAPGGRAIGSVPARSKYLGSSMQAWVQAVTPDGRWGKVTLPWTRQVSRTGWISLVGLQRSSTRVLVVGDLSDRMLRVYRGCSLQFAAPMAIGSAGSPSPVGRFWVTDRVAVPPSQPYFGSYAFGLSTIQPNPPAGWTGGNQMAIHGTNTPGSIGTAASAGCLRVSEGTLARLRRSVGIGTPVVITR